MQSKFTNSTFKFNFSLLTQILLPYQLILQIPYIVCRTTHQPYHIWLDSHL